MMPLLQTVHTRIREFLLNGLQECLIWIILIVLLGTFTVRCYMKETLSLHSWEQDRFKSCMYEGSWLCRYKHLYSIVLHDALCPLSRKLCLHDNFDTNEHETANWRQLNLCIHLYISVDHITDVTPESSWFHYCVIWVSQFLPWGNYK